MIFTKFPIDLLLAGLLVHLIVICVAFLATNEECDGVDGDLSWPYNIY